MVPLVGCSNPAIIRSTVVLPEPDGPSIEKNSPDPTVRSTSSTATTGGRPENSLRSALSLIAGVDVPGLVSVVADEVMGLLADRSGIKTYGPICFDCKTLVQIVAEVEVADLSLGLGTYAAVFAPLEPSGRAEAITRRL